MTGKPSPFTYEERFWQKVDRRSGDECWEWRGAINAQGYGVFGQHGERRAHRISWVMANGPIPDGMFVCHHCDNPGCVNPAHLFVGTPRENSRDSLSKGRHFAPRGEYRSNAKLTETAVLEIRAIYQKGSPTFGAKALARRFGVHHAHISRIISGQKWKHV